MAAAAAAKVAELAVEVEGRENVKLGNAVVVVVLVLVLMGLRKREEGRVGGDELSSEWRLRREAAWWWRGWRELLAMEEGVDNGSEVVLMLMLMMMIKCVNWRKR